MDEIKNHEDIERTPLRPDRIQAFLHLFLGVLFFLGALIICSSLSIFICSHIVYGDFRGLSQAPILLDELKKHAFVQLDKAKDDAAKLPRTKRSFKKIEALC